jgi:UDP-N-acetyl-2-amino-2-deoxyglucuronate dehydrogenase
MIKIGLVGCGRISLRHFECIEANPEFKLMAVCDIDKNKAESAAKKYGIPYYTDYETFLEKAGVELVDICTPSGLHPPMGIQAAEKGFHIILEKPMGLDYRLCEQLVETCDKKNLKLFVVKQNRFNSPVQKLKSAIVSGRFGKIFLANTTVRWRRTQEYYDSDPWRGTWEFDGGVLMNQASHHVDLLQWLVGDVKNVTCKARTYFHKIKTDDTSLVMLEFKNGALGSIEATTCTSPYDLEGSVTILGEHGTVRIGGFAVNKMEMWKFEDNRPNEEEEVKQFNQNPPNVYGFGHKQYFNNVAQVMLGKDKPMTDGKEGLKTLKLILGIYKSAAKGCEINLDTLSFD